MAGHQGVAIRLGKRQFPGEVARCLGCRVMRCGLERDAGRGKSTKRC